MKRYRILIFILFVVISTYISAETGDLKNIKFSYGIEHLDNKNGDFLNLKSSYTVGFSVGKSYNLHKTPLLNILTFCFDVTYLDLKFSDYSNDYQKKYAVGNSYLFNIDASIHIGPSIRLNITPKFKVNSYFHLAPTFTDFYNGEFKQYDYRYSNLFVVGVNIVYSKVSVGFDYRTSTTNHKFKVRDDYNIEKIIEGKMHKSAPMVYLSFCF